MENLDQKHEYKGCPVIDPLQLILERMDQLEEKIDLIVLGISTGIHRMKDELDKHNLREHLE